jgi:hypothetical protein
MISVALSRNIVFKFARKFLKNLLNIKNMFPFVKIIIANEDDMLLANDGECKITDYS